MKGFAQSVFPRKDGSLGKKYNHWLLYLLVLGVLALIDFLHLEHVRHTFVFYTLGERTMIVENRMIPKLASQELEIRHYVEEALLGPVSPESSPLFSRDTRLRSLLYRDGVVYLDLSEAAALPPLEGSPLREGEVYQNLDTLDEGIRRNFTLVKEVKVFINGYMVPSSSQGIQG